MSAEFKIFDLNENLSIEENFQNRYVNPSKLSDFLIKNYKSLLTEIGRSELNKPIYKLTLGKGPKNILLWTQMHGNETTGTLSCLDLLKFFENENNCSHEILSKFTLDIIFMLNPDGAEIWTRRNRLGIDINRDFLTASSIEMQVLKKTASEKKYDLAFNLHDQRTIFGVEGKKEPATLAFLSPSESVDRKVTETRKKSMGLIADIYKEISKLIPNKISRFTDEFYPRSVGDNFQKLGIPTILFEGGHFPKDYYRQKTRRYFTLSLITALYYASIKDEWQKGYELYNEIPNNSLSFFDIIYRNVRIREDKKETVDIGIQYAEKITKGENELSFIAKIEDIGDLSFMYGHEEIDAEGRCIVFADSAIQFPKIGILADFKLDEWIIVNGKKLDSFT
ncbi:MULTISPECIES: M14 family zinc carboxypeptidase [unclassified Apibacter]|uniref:M14 family zinc carboxypeptidase n=1 Tax=unclassified Apibacter TaxID=2630820 RepID=UPI00132955EC|nr:MULTISPECIES: M14 family zinc carboxypeptidase [unclassified Apibacter]MCX8676199.1 peptidase M14 [Apibacter sp. B3919]MXO25257.1 peptidase M14 [Apibacter sp. B3924]MXO26651.1 peptidase M14 [Apibacter sp. B3813]MXO29380.1 peptidase M14 [Apibacter sp. B3913]MXO30929.1 peptidase M14 [Apibacter sp. B3912]